MPVPTADELDDAAATLAAEGVQSATVDGRSATAMDPLKQLKVADAIRARALTASNSGMGGWGIATKERVIPPGAC